MKSYHWWEVYDLSYIKYLIEDWYLDHIAWRVRHHLFQERCETCRNWEYAGKRGGWFMGICHAFHCGSADYTDYHGHCGLYNVDLLEDERGYTRVEDGCERPMKTTTGKWITVISRKGHWQYLYDGMPKWYEKAMK